MKNFLFILAGSFIFSVSVAWIASPLGLVSGGVSGVGIVVKEVTGIIPIALTSFILNLPLFIISFLQRGWRFVSKSLSAFLCLTVFLWILEAVKPPFDLGGDLLVGAFLYGALAGVGLGLVLRAGATSGGTDMLASIIKRKRPHLKISFLILVIDVLVIAMGVFLFGITRGVYATLSLAVSVKVIDMTLSGVSSAKTVFIMSDKSDKIASLVMTELKRGVTGLNARGLYTGREKTLLFSVVSAREISALERMVYNADPDAFMTVNDAKKVLGEGFDSLINDENSLV
ncbi:MAG: YitT family protein [Clostridia bacterium]|nr:YitT family protein [Clostridia bacterium]